MRLEDLEAVTSLNRKVSNCDFHLETLRAGPRSITIGTSRQPLVTDYGDRLTYVTDEFITETHASIVRQLEARRAEHVAALLDLGVEVDAIAKAAA